MHIYRFPIPENQVAIISGLWHSPYYFLAFFEARKEISASLGFSVDRLMEEGYGIAVLQLNIKFFHPLKLGDTALIRLVVEKIGNSSMVFKYLVYKEGEEDTLCAEGTVMQLLIDHKSKKPAEMPQWFRDHLLSLQISSTD